MNMEDVLEKVGMECSYEKLKTAIQYATNIWISNLIKGYPEDLSELIDNVVNREFNFDSNAIVSLKNENATAIINCPRAKITIGNLTVNGMTKKTDDYKIEFSFNASRLKHNPTDSFLKVFHKNHYTNNKVVDKSSPTKVDNGPHEFLEVAVLKKETESTKKWYELIFRTQRNNELKDSFVGRIIIPLSKAFEYNKMQHSWPLELAGITVGTINLSFDFINQDNASAHELFVSHISDMVMNNFNDLWNLNKSTPRKVSISDQSLVQLVRAACTSDAKLPPLMCYVQVTLLPNIRESPTAENKSLSRKAEEDKTKESDDDELEIRLNKKMVESTFRQGNRYLIPIHSFKHNVISLSVVSHSIVNEKNGQETKEVRNIPWKFGIGKFAIGNNHCRLELVCDAHGYGIDEVTFVEAIKCLVLLLLHNELTKKRSEGTGWWNGNLGGNSVSIVSVIHPFFTANEWEAIEAWALLKVHPFFEDMIKGSMINQKLKHLQRPAQDDHQKVAHIIKFNEKEELLEKTVSRLLQTVIEKAQAQVDRVLLNERKKYAKKEINDSEKKDTSMGVANLSVIYTDNDEISYLDKLDIVTEELGGAFDVRRIFQSCIGAWEDLELDDCLKKTEFGVSVFRKLHDLFICYMNGIKAIVLKDQILDLDELTYVLKSLFHLQQEYVVIFWNKLAAEMQSCGDGQNLFDEEHSKQMINKVKESVEDMIQTLINRFAIKEQRDLRQFLNTFLSTLSTSGEEEQEVPQTNKTCGNCINLVLDVFTMCRNVKTRADTEDTIRLVNNNKDDISSEVTLPDTLKNNGHIYNLLDKFEYNVGQGVTDDIYGIDKKVIEDVCTRFKQKIFEVQLENIKEQHNLAKERYVETKNVAVFRGLDEVLTIDKELRRKFEIDDNLSKVELLKIEQEIKLKHEDSILVISKYFHGLYSQTFKKDHRANHAGTLTYNAGVIGGEQLVISLKSVANLRPRKNKETCSFSIEAVLFPNSTSTKSKQSTPVYKDRTSSHVSNIGNVQADDGKYGEHNFIFPLTHEDHENTSIKKFIEFRLLDHSNTWCREHTYLVGHVLHPLDEFPEYSSLDEFGTKKSTIESIFKNYNISDIVGEDEDNKNDQFFRYWNELKCRQDNVASNFVRSQDKMELLSIN